MEVELYKVLMEMDQKLNAIIEKVYAKEIAEQQAKEKAAQGKKTQPPPGGVLTEQEENEEENEGFDSEGIPELKSDPNTWQPTPYDDGLIDEEEEQQEFANFQEQQEKEEVEKKLKMQQNNRNEGQNQQNQQSQNGPLTKPKKRNIFLTED